MSIEIIIEIGRYVTYQDLFVVCRKESLYALNYCHFQMRRLHTYITYTVENLDQVE